MELNNIIGKGARAKVYSSGKYAIKIFDKNYNKKDVFYEAYLNSLIESTGLPVAKTYEVVSINEQLAIKMDYIKGNSVIDCMLNNMQEVTKYIEKMVDLQIEINKKIVELPFSFKEIIRNRIEANTMLNPAQQKNILERLAKLPTGKNLCHGDFHGYNILNSNDQYYVIDWTNASYGEPNADVCRTYLIYLLQAPEIADKYLAIYCEKTGKSKDEITVWLPVLAAARLIENIEGEEEKLKSIIL